MNKKFLSVIGALIILGAFTTSQASVISIEKSLSPVNDGVNKVETRGNIIETAIVADEVITIKVVPGEMRFDKTKFSVKDGTTVKVDRKSVVEGKSVSVRVDLGGGRIHKK